MTDERSPIRIHVLHCGSMLVSKAVPYGGGVNLKNARRGVFDKVADRVELPVSAYLIECAHGNVLFDCGWHRDMSPHGVFERRAQIRSLGSLPLYFTNQVVVESSAAIDEQLAARGIAVRAGLHCAPAVHAWLGTLQSGAIRFSPGLYNTAQEMDDTALLLARLLQA